jgi:CMP-N,N'-diacetyllegionaminic acid synthase
VKVTVLGIITARGGSKGIPRKNIAPLLGRPLLAYTADAALRSRRLTRVLLSTDSEEIAEVGRSCGLSVPFLRPAELARDDTPTLPVLQHAVTWVERGGERYEAICLLQPTNPLRREEDIDACIDLLERSDAETVATILQVPAEYNPHWVYEKDAQGYLRLATGETQPIPRRQDLPPAFHREGSVYVTRREILMEGNCLCGKRFTGFVLDASRSVNIDEPEDLERAETLALMRRRAERVQANSGRF